MHFPLCVRDGRAAAVQQPAECTIYIYYLHGVMCCDRELQGKMGFGALGSVSVSAAPLPSVCAIVSDRYLLSLSAVYCVAWPSARAYAGSGLECAGAAGAAQKGADIV